MKNINISVDGGGTNLRIIAFNDDLNLIAQSKSGPVNSNFESIENIRFNIAEAAQTLFANLSGDYRIKNIYGTIVGPADLFNQVFMKEAGKFAEDARICAIPEGYSHLFAASLGDKGGIALAGTGSGAIYCNGSDMIHLGGYGIPVGDEGSGAWIGIQGISAAVKHINGWGEKTLLTDKLYKYLNIVSPASLIGALYRKDINQRSLFAGFCGYVAECERTGDKAAKDIIHSAGRYMGLQMISALKRAEEKNMLDASKENPVIFASGGAWKGSPYMLGAMRKTVCGEYPGAVCFHGIFDPVIGGAVKFIFEKTGENKISKEVEDHLKREFNEYVVRFDAKGEK